MRVDRVDNVHGPRGSPTKMIPLIWGPLIVPCPWASEGLATPVTASRYSGVFIGFKNIYIIYTATVEHEKQNQYTLENRKNQLCDIKHLAMEHEIASPRCISRSRLVHFGEREVAPW